MKAIAIFSDGSTKKKTIVRKRLLEGLDLHIRDLRPVFSLRQISTISPKEKVIIINFGEVKLLVQKTEALLFGADKKSIEEEFLPQLLESIRTAQEGYFLEFVVLETTLNFALRQARQQLAIYEKSIQLILQKLKGRFVDQDFERLLVEKKHLSKLQISVREQEGAIEEIVKDDEDLQMLCLGSMQSKNEMESILEHALEQFENLEHHIEELTENIDDTQEIITLKMANRRNVIIKFDLYATFITAVLSGLAVITGVFGMNLQNGFESSMTAFLFVAFGVLALFLLAFFVIRWYIRREDIW